MSEGTGMAPILPRDPASLPEELPRGAEIPEDHDPLAAGVLMAHQLDWIEDESDLKLGEKGRRTGVTYAEALDDTLIAAKKKSEGGQNVFYIGDTKDKGREFIGYVAHFAKIVAGELAQIEEFMFEDEREDGSSKFISAYRVRFSSGSRVEALSSRPENIRGLQGVVVIDEAAFHKDVRGVLDAVNALLIWGGKIRVISTHNGVLNPFNELIREAKAGKNPFKVHFIPFKKAVENGLYKRVCLITGKKWSAEAEAEWEAKIRASYGPRTSAMEQELDAIPSEAEGAALTRVQIEACMTTGIPIVRWTLPDAFKNYPEHVRKTECKAFCERELKPILDQLDPRRPHYLGQDFARSGDVSGVLVAETDAMLTRNTKFVLEMRNVPFDQQRDVLFYIGDALPRFSGAALDATGNGAYLAEKAVQRWGERALEVKFTVEWYRINSTPYVEAFSDRTIVLPRDEDVLRDHQALAYVKGVIKVPDDMRYKGMDGFDRHGDTAIAGLLMWHASQLGAVEYDYTPAPPSDRDDDPSGWLFPERASEGRSIW
jgi:phage FluMu gp28-like protein